MKKNAIARILMSALLIAALLALSIPAALAEEEAWYTVTIDIKMDSNLVLARYGATVYLDGEELGVLPHGGSLVKIVTDVTAGIHTISLRPEKLGVPTLNMDFNVEGPTDLNARVATHRKSISIVSLNIKASAKARQAPAIVKQEPQQTQAPVQAAETETGDQSVLDELVEDIIYLFITEMISGLAS